MEDYFQKYRKLIIDFQRHTDDFKMIIIFLKILFKELQELETTQDIMLRLGALECVTEDYIAEEE